MLIRRFFRAFKYFIRGFISLSIQAPARVRDFIVVLTLLAPSLDILFGVSLVGGFLESIRIASSKESFLHQIHKIAGLFSRRSLFTYPNNLYGYLLSLPLP